MGFGEIMIAVAFAATAAVGGAADSVMRTIRGGEISMIFQEPMRLNVLLYEYKINKL